MQGYSYCCAAEPGPFGMQAAILAVLMKLDQTAELAAAAAGGTAAVRLKFGSGSCCRRPLDGACKTSNVILELAHLDNLCTILPLHHPHVLP